jgi:hypothetical protein
MADVKKHLFLSSKEEQSILWAAEAILVIGLLRHLIHLSMLLPETLVESSQRATSRASKCRSEQSVAVFLESLCARLSEFGALLRVCQM